MRDVSQRMFFFGPGAIVTPLRLCFFIYFCRNECCACKLRISLVEDERLLPNPSLVDKYKYA